MPNVCVRLLLVFLFLFCFVATTVVCLLVLSEPDKIANQHVNDRVLREASLRLSLPPLEQLCCIAGGFCCIKSQGPVALLAFHSTLPDVTVKHSMVSP